MKFDFRKFRIFEILNFHPWACFLIYFQEILDRKTEQLELQKEKLNSFNPKKSGSDKKEVKDPGGVVVHMKPGEVVEQKPVPGVGAGVDGRVKYDVQSWSGSYAMLKKAVSVAADMCSWEEAPKAEADIQVSKV